MSLAKTDEITVTLKISTEMVPYIQSSLAFLADMCYTYGMTDDGKSPEEGWKKHCFDSLGWLLQINACIGKTILDE